jgi:hypothetical protein
MKQIMIVLPAAGIDPAVQAENRTDTSLFMKPDRNAYQAEMQSKGGDLYQSAGHPARVSSNEDTLHFRLRLTRTSHGNRGDRLVVRRQAEAAAPSGRSRPGRGVPTGRSGAGGDFLAPALSAIS